MENTFSMASELDSWTKYTRACNYAYRIHGRMLNVIKSLYQNLESCVCVNGRLTDWFSQTAGVRQGDVLSPTLFALFINDLAYDVKERGAVWCEDWK